MSLKDKFPQEIEFEIDRERLLGYLLMQSRLGCYGIVLPFALLFAFTFFTSHMAPYRDAGLLFQLGWLTIYLLAGLFACAVLGSLFYFPYFRPSARLKANNLRLLVEGPFLRLVSGGFIVLDQRFHFRDVSCYATVQGPLLRRHCLTSLQFRIQGRLNSPPLSVAGLADADRVRDTLCEIDASRELPTSLPDSGSASQTGG
ncbi:hypothetical protein [Allorhodopirellula solitaria]|uniref:DUF304 domain-containing protein n=1 Tax=Allorhodopirellula solitaria TaxID=2527987 RepID=A0A5C5XQT7_9BACT|nr:hypothetical protein [Allorhodopirellula solitaria]TWT64999.1 hypothetical protein CA85_33440 [Allorhodopirellula solitaria]